MKHLKLDANSRGTVNKVLFRCGPHIRSFDITLNGRDLNHDYEAYFDKLTILRERHSSLEVLPLDGYRNLHNSLTREIIVKETLRRCPRLKELKLDTHWDEWLIHCLF